MRCSFLYFLLIALGIFVLNVSVFPVAKQEAEDAYAYAQLVEQVDARPWYSLTDDNHMLYLPMMRGGYRAAMGFGHWALGIGHWVSGDSVQGDFNAEAERRGGLKAKGGGLRTEDAPNTQNLTPKTCYEVAPSPHNLAPAPKAHPSPITKNLESVPFRAASMMRLMSAFFGAAGIFVAMQIFNRFLRLSVGQSIFGGLLIGFSYAYWRYSCEVEIYSLAAFLGLLTIYNAFSICRVASHDSAGRLGWRLVVAGLLAGFSLTVHVGLIPVVAAVVYYMFRRFSFKQGLLYFAVAAVWICGVYGVDEHLKANGEHQTPNIEPSTLNEGAAGTRHKPLSFGPESLMAVPAEDVPSQLVSSRQNLASLPFPLSFDGQSVPIYEYADEPADSVAVFQSGVLGNTFKWKLLGEVGVRGFLGAAQSLVCGNFLFSYPWVRDQLLRHFPYRDLSDDLHFGEFYDGHPLVYIATGTLTLWGLVLLFALRYAWTHWRWIWACIKKRKAQAFLVWFGVALAMVLAREPDNPELWSFPILPFLMLLTVILCRTIRYRAVYLLIIGLLLFHNWCGGIGLLQKAECDLYQVKTQRWAQRLEPRDILVTNADPISVRYYRYLLANPIVSMQEVLGGGPGTFLFDALPEGYRFVFAEDVFDLPSYVQYRRPQLYERMSQFRSTAEAVGFAKE